MDGVPLLANAKNGKLRLLDFDWFILVLPVDRSGCELSLEMNALAVPEQLHVENDEELHILPFFVVAC
jgi:hypothetical protein